MTKPTKVQAPEGCMPHLTAGKIYSVVGFWDNDISDNFGYGFTIISDLGNEISCNERNCAHLNNGNWIVIKTEQSHNIMTTQTKRQELFLDPNHPNYAELINAGLSERDTCEFYLTNDGKAIAFNFSSIDEYMKYLSKLQGSRVEVELMYGLLGWKYTDSYCLDNRPDGEDWVKFDVLTYHEELKNMIPPYNATEIEHLLNCTYTVVRHAYNYKHMDLFFRFIGSQFQIEPVERNLMECDGKYFMGIVFNLSDVKP